MNNFQSIVEKLNVENQNWAMSPQPILKLN